MAYLGARLGAGRRLSGSAREWRMTARRHAEGAEPSEGSRETAINEGGTGCPAGGRHGGARAYAADMGNVSWAKELAGALLGRDERRLSHVRAVARRAEELGALALAGFPVEQEVGIVAAWVHDLGYAEALVRTGCHHLDGARYLRDLGEERLAGLVAYHSSGAAEAGLRGLSDELARYRHDESLVSDLLTYCDLSTGPDGDAVGLDERLAEVSRRYGPGHVVTRGLLQGEGALRATFARIEALVAANGPLAAPRR